MIGKRCALVLVCGLAVGVVAGGVWGDEKPDKKKPGKLEIGGARHRLEKLEQKVKLARGQPMKLGYVENEALRRIKALKEKYPDDAEVQALFQRARKALVLSKGETIEITPQMLVYRENEKKLKTIFSAEAEKAWADYRKKVLAAKGTITKPFPPASHREVSFKQMKGRYVILENFEYPRNEFADRSQQFVFVGSGARGYYFVELSNRSWLGAYEAFKRYRRFINRDLPEGGKWTVVGRITTIELLVPQAGKKKTKSAHWGWGVEPEAIYLPGHTFAWADGTLEVGGTFGGEDRMEQIKGAMYTVTSIPDDVTPKRLAEIFATAIKEKNHPLYLECIDPNRRKTPKGLDLCMYHWELHQHRFANFYVHVTVGKPKIRVIKGFAPGSGNVEDFFLSDEEKAKIKKHAEPLLEHAELKSKAWDERGRQYGSPKPRFFKRIAKGRWYIMNYPQPF